MKIFKSSLTLIVAFLTIAVLMAVSAIPAEAFLIQEKTGMIGVTDGQTLRVNVTNLGSNAGPSPHIKVFDAMGNVVARFDSDRLPAGISMSFDLNRDDILDSRGRLELRVETELEVPDDTNSRRVRDSIRITVEIFDNATGKTEVFWGNPDE